MAIINVSLKIEDEKGLGFGGVLLSKALCSDADYENSYFTLFALHFLI